MFYNTCPYCGANLDPGEKCDCQEQRVSNEMSCKEKILRILDELDEKKLRRVYLFLLGMTGICIP